MFLANRTEADFQEWRDQEAWTAEKYRRSDRGERMPADWRPGPRIETSSADAQLRFPQEQSPGFVLMVLTPLLNGLCAWIGLTISGTKRPCTCN